LRFSTAICVFPCALVDAIAGKGQPLASGVDGLKSMATALTALQAARDGRKLALEFSSA
jgi:predicted dehydrogenase